MTEDRGEKVLSNLIWRFAERCGAQVVQFIVSVILARLLQPEDFGMVSLVLIFSGILQVFVDSGLGNALIQKKNVDTLDFSTVFYFNVVWCLILYGISFLMAPYLAYFFGKNEMTWIFRILCLSVIISGFKNVQQAYVSRTLQFRKFFFATLIGTVTSAVIGISLALNGCGVWALVFQKLTNLLIDTVVLWFSVNWHPIKAFSWKRLSTLIAYGWKLLLSALIDSVYNNLRQFVIGRFYTEADLAYYNQGRQFPNLIVTNINASIDSVLFPVLSEKQDDIESIRKMTRRSIKMSTYIMAPLMVGLFVIAESIVKIILTDKWLPCVIFLKISCVNYAFYPIHTANLNAIKAMGRSDLYLKIEIQKKVIGTGLLLLTMKHGVEAMAYSLLISTLASQMLNSFPNKKLLEYGYAEQMKDIIPNFMMAIIMGGTVKLIEYSPLFAMAEIFIQIVTGIVIYLIMSAITRNDSFKYLTGIIHGRKNRMFS